MKPLERLRACWLEVGDKHWESLQTLRHLSSAAFKVPGGVEGRAIGENLFHSLAEALKPVVMTLTRTVAQGSPVVLATDFLFARMKKALTMAMFPGVSMLLDIRDFWLLLVLAWVVAWSTQAALFLSSKEILVFASCPSCSHCLWKGGQGTMCCSFHCVLMTSALCISLFSDPLRAAKPFTQWLMEMEMWIRASCPSVHKWLKLEKATGSFLPDRRCVCSSKSKQYCASLVHSFCDFCFVFSKSCTYTGANFLLTMCFDGSAISYEIIALVLHVTIIWTGTKCFFLYRQSYDELFGEVPPILEAG